MMMLRPLFPSEYDAVASWAIAEQWPGRNKHALLVKNEFSEIVDLPGHLSFGFSEKHAPTIGFGQVWINAAGAVSLVRILVAPNLRGQGFGKKLCALLLAEAFRVTGTDTVTLRVYRSNKAAVAVYRSLGFEVLEGESNDEVFAMAAKANSLSLKKPRTTSVHAGYRLI